MSTNPHHEGKQSLEFKPNEEKVMRIKPYELRIIWGKDVRYWSVPAEDDNERPAELYQVSWLEVTGCVSATEPQKEYELGFEISLTPDAFGWSGSPVYILVKRGKNGKFKGHKFMLDEQKDTVPIKAKVPKLETANSDVDSEENSKIYFGLYEVWRGKWKGGLKIHHAFIREI